jgi:hypothetical protein
LLMELWPCSHIGDRLALHLFHPLCPADGPRAQAVCPAEGGPTAGREETGMPTPPWGS